MKCHCGSQQSFLSCCHPIIEGKTKAQSPEALMRSRYSAFVTHEIDYLVNTHWPIDFNSKQQIQKTAETTEWLGLKVIKETTNQSMGEVEFVAFFNEQGIQQLHEKSTFQKIENQWYYCSGEHLPPIKLNRNEVCFCGSGKKFKKCHLR